MLVLGARIGERIFVGEGDVAVMLVQDRSGHIRLGFEAPPEVRIERERVRNRRLRITNDIPAATLPPEYK